MVYNHPIKDPNTIRILVVGNSLAGISVVKPLLDLLKKPEAQKSGKLFEIVLLDSRRGFINAFAAPRSIIDPEFAKGTYCVFEQMNFPDTDNDEDYKHVSLVSVNGWCVELHEHYCQIKNFDEDFYTMEFTYCVFAAGKSKKYPFTPNAYTKNSFIEEMYKTSSDISKANRVLVVAGPDVIGLETAALIKSHYPNKQVGLCFEDAEFPEFDPMLFKNLVDLYHDNQEKQKKLKKLQFAQREALLKNDPNAHSVKDEKFFKQIVTKLRRLSVSTKNRARSSSRSKSPQLGKDASTSVSPSNSHGESPQRPNLEELKLAQITETDNAIINDNENSIDDDDDNNSNNKSNNDINNDDDDESNKNNDELSSPITPGESDDPILHFRHVLRDELLNVGVQLMPGVRPLRSIGFNEYYGEQSYRRSSSNEDAVGGDDSSSLRPKLVKYSSFDTYSKSIAGSLETDYGYEDETEIVSKGLITKDDELIETDVLLWCARGKPNTSAFKNTKLASCLSPITNEVLVDKHGKIAPHSNLFAIGDCSNFDKVLTKNKIFDIPSASLTVSGIVFVGRLVAQNIFRTIFNEELLSIHDFNQLYTESDIDNGLIYNKETIKLYNTIESLEQQQQQQQQQQQSSKSQSHSPSRSSNNGSNTHGSNDDLVRDIVHTQKLFNHPLITFPRFIVSLGVHNCVSLDPESLITRVNDPKDLDVIADFRCSLISSLLNITFAS